VYTGLELKKILNKAGFNATVLDPVFIKPLDTEILCKLLLTLQRFVTIEEHSLVSGMGSIINNYLMTLGYSHVQVANFGVPETFVEQGTHAELINELGLNPQKIFQRIALQFNLKIPSVVNI
jgi:1-deoxy-D-xylulose-5-phosphate synthase